MLAMMCKCGHFESRHIPGPACCVCECAAFTHKTDLSANDGLGLVLMIYTPAKNKREWQEHYFDGKELAGMDSAEFQFDWPIGEIIFENDTKLTHEGALEDRSEGVQEFIEMPETYGYHK